MRRLFADAYSSVLFFPSSTALKSLLIFSKSAVAYLVKEKKKNYKSKTFYFQFLKYTAVSYTHRKLLQLPCTVFRALVYNSFTGLLVFWCNSFELYKKNTYNSNSCKIRTEKMGPTLVIKY